MKTGIIEKYASEKFDAILLVHSDYDPWANSIVSLEKQMYSMTSMRVPMQNVFKRVANGTMKWASCVFPTKGYSKLAGMEHEAYEKMILEAVGVNELKPIEFWKNLENDQARMISKLKDKRIIHIEGEGTDLTLSIAGRKWINCAGFSNLPDGEIYTGPVEDSLEGCIYFKHPIMYKGNVATGVRLVFKNGKCIKATAEEGEEYLRSMIALDEGSAYAGEFAIGTNAGIQVPTGHILLDEKIKGTIHIALGNGYPMTGSVNKSALHWDFICDLRENGRVTADGETIMENGEILI